MTVRLNADDFEDDWLHDMELAWLIDETDTSDERVWELAHRVAKLDATIDGLEIRMKGMKRWQNTRIDGLEKRIRRLERQ
jgi:polyhydroxyalkanoate synthesis regulator phasin